MISITTGVYYTQAANCRFCLHIGMVAMYIGYRPGWTSLRLELFTPRHRFRLSRPRPLKQAQNLVTELFGGN